MTWAQVTFAYCFVILVPLVGFLFARRWKLANKSTAIGFLAGASLMIAAMVGCCFLAMACYPEYPRKPVSEWIANAFTLPAIAVAIGAFWIPKPAAERKRFVKRCTVVLLVAYIAGIGFTRWATLWPYRRALPWSATEIQERFWTEGFLPDFDYHLKAKISEEEFYKYVKRFGLEKGTGSGFGSAIDNEEGKHSEKAIHYHWERGDSYMKAAYLDGYIYVEAGEF